MKGEKMRNLFKLLGAIVTGLIIIAFGSYLWYQNAISMPNGNSSAAEEFKIEKGQGIDTIANNLVTNNFVANKLALQIYLKLNPNLANTIQAGSFELSNSMSISEIVKTLQKAKDVDFIKITIPEGMRFDEIADVIDKKFAGTANNKFSKTDYLAIAGKPQDISFSTGVQDFLKQNKPAEKNLEGYLYPDTYFFKFGSTAQEVIERQIGTLMDKLSANNLLADFNDDGKIKPTGETASYTLYEVLNIASLIERETFTAAEKPMVADILYRRLEKGVQGVKLLQVDAALLYPAKDWKANAYLLKQQDNPYNTYKYAGLPPTPIANPGIIAILAAAKPEANDYWFYIHDKNAKIHYAKTLAEHEANIAKYL